MARLPRSRRTDMRRAVAALRTLAVAASLAAASLTITPPPPLAARRPAGPGRDRLLGPRDQPDLRGDPRRHGTRPAPPRAAGNLGTGARLVARRIPPPVRPGQRFEGHRPYLDHERRRNRPAPARLR